jgi:hypothetical protein
LCRRRTNGAGLHAGIEGEGRGRADLHGFRLKRLNPGGDKQSSTLTNGATGLALCLNACMVRIMLHGDAARGTFYVAAGFCVKVCRRRAVKFSGAEQFSHLGTDWNTTTRDRQLGHEKPKILCFGADFPLTELSHLFTLRRQIRGIVIRRADDPSPRERRNAD